MKITVKNNTLMCKDINSLINHMECNDECVYFKGCAVIDGQFVIECAYKKSLVTDKEPVSVS
ncbi:hypothetical protein J7L67_04610 [bacterium]|nr:hypothetical protein [bacterium]